MEREVTYYKDFYHERVLTEEEVFMNSLIVSAGLVEIEFECGYDSLPADMCNTNNAETSVPSTSNPIFQQDKLKNIVSKAKKSIDVRVSDLQSMTDKGVRTYGNRRSESASNPVGSSKTDISSRCINTAVGSTNETDISPLISSIKTESVERDESNSSGLSPKFDSDRVSTFCDKDSTDNRCLSDHRSSDVVVKTELTTIHNSNLSAGSFGIHKSGKLPSNNFDKNSNDNKCLSDYRNSDADHGIVKTELTTIYFSDLSPSSFDIHEGDKLCSNDFDKKSNDIDLTIVKTELIEMDDSNLNASSIKMIKGDKISSSYLTKDSTDIKCSSFDLGIVKTESIDIDDSNLNFGNSDIDLCIVKTSKLGGGSFEMSKGDRVFSNDLQKDSNINRRNSDIDLSIVKTESIEIDDSNLNAGSIEIMDKISSKDFDKGTIDNGTNSDINCCTVKTRSLTKENYSSDCVKNVLVKQEKVDNDSSKSFTDFAEHETDNASPIDSLKSPKDCFVEAKDRELPFDRQMDQGSLKDSDCDVTNSKLPFDRQTDQGSLKDSDCDVTNSKLPFDQKSSCSAADVKPLCNNSDFSKGGYINKIVDLSEGYVLKNSRLRLIALSNLINSNCNSISNNDRGGIGNDNDVIVSNSGGKSYDNDRDSNSGSDRDSISNKNRDSVSSSNGDSNDSTTDQKVSNQGGNKNKKRQGLKRTRVQNALRVSTDCELRTYKKRRTPNNQYSTIGSDDSDNRSTRSGDSEDTRFDPIGTIVDTAESSQEHEMQFVSQKAGESSLSYRRTSSNYKFKLMEKDSELGICYECTICQQTMYGSTSNHACHKSVPLPDYSCYYCDYFVGSSLLQIPSHFDDAIVHFEKTNSLKVVKCLLLQCPFKSISMNCLYYHSTVIHNIQIAKNFRSEKVSYPCSECPSVFSKPYYLKKHVKECHKTPEYSFSCKLCDYKSVYFTSLKIHVAYAHKNRPKWLEQIEVEETMRSKQLNSDE